MTHGIMFHYFYNDQIPKTQGSICEDVLEKIIDKYSKDHHLLNAKVYLEKAIKGSLLEDDVCITFDDGLYSQYYIADKVLQKKGLTAFYFVYTSPMDGILEKMEVYRTFRNKYDLIDDFYHDFFSVLIEYGYKIGKDYKGVIESKQASEYFLKYEYYTRDDRIFRYLRNEILADKYDIVMDLLMDKQGFIPQIECKNIWIDPAQLREMEGRGNVIGLHSHTHFTSLNGLSYEDKKREYSTNKVYLEKILHEKVNSASYPCDTYDSDSDEILSSLGINIAFLAHYENFKELDLHRIPRIDASAILKTL